MSKFTGTKRTKEEKKEWRSDFTQKLDRLFKEYKKILIVDIDNIQSRQLNQIRRLLRGKAELCFGKKSIIHRYMRSVEDENIKKLIDYVQLNTGFIFTNGDFKPIMEAITASRRKAAAKAGQIAPDDVVIQPFLTNLGPEMTSFFAALKIETKISKNKIEITRPVNLISKGDKVTPNNATLLQRLEIVPFFYEAVVKAVYDDGKIFDAEVLQVDDERMQKEWDDALSQFTGLALGAGIPVVSAVPHVIVNSLKAMLGLGVVSGIETIPDVKRIADLLK